MGMFSRRDPSPPPEPIRWTTVAVALHQPEAEMLQGMLEAEGVPVMIRRTTVDVPEMLAGGPRGVMVPEENAHEARQILGLDEDMQPVS
jgi:hypothetical protein